jgi:hypothetical protein
VSCPLRAVHTATGCGNKLRVPLVERRIFENEHYVLLNPRLKVADGEKDAAVLAGSVPVLTEASGERLFLLVGLQLRQQQCVTDADLLAVKRIHNILR